MPAADAKPLTPAEQAAASIAADPVGATVATAQMLFTLSVSMVAKLQKVELTPAEFESVAKLTPGELSTLRALAPAAAPYIMRGLERAPLLGALAFAGAIVVPMAGRFRELKRIRAERPPKPKPQPAPPTPPKNATEAAVATTAPPKVPAAPAPSNAGTSKAPAS